MYQPIVKDVEKNVGGQNYFQVINYQKPSSDTLGFLPDIGKKYIISMSRPPCLSIFDFSKSQINSLIQMTLENYLLLNVHILI